MSKFSNMVLRLADEFSRTRKEAWIPEFNHDYDDLGESATIRLGDDHNRFIQLIKHNDSDDIEVDVNAVRDGVDFFPDCGAYPGPIWVNLNTDIANAAMTIDTVLITPWLPVYKRGMVEMYSR